MAKPISVVMPVRNGEAFLGAAIESVLGQSVGDFEFIIVDDGSSDRTPSILETFRDKDSRIRLARTDGTGIVAALNLGISNASGDYVARMDADDIALPERFATQREALEGSSNLLALGSAATEIDASGNAGGVITVPAAPEAIRSALRRTNPILHPTVMMRREAVLSVGGYRNALTNAEDYDLWLRLSRQGDIANLETPLLNLRRHGGQISGLRRLEQRAATAFARLLDAEVQRDGEGPGDMSVTLHQALRRHLTARLANAVPITETEARELAVMLRAANRAKLLNLGETWALCRRISIEGGLQDGWTLPVKLLLGR